MFAILTAGENGDLGPTIGLYINVEFFVVALTVLEIFRICCRIIS